MPPLKHPSAPPHRARPTAPGCLQAPGGEPLRGWAAHPRLSLLNLMYDATPADHVSVIITEVGAVPPTSVPAILREYRQDPVG
jgi:translation initiation factor 2B subunit (eIF-2B alpha/beta/delta family)